MARACVRLLILLLFQVAGDSVASGQDVDPRARESEWNDYKPPTAEFARFVGETKIILFRAPANWERTGYLQFKGPHDSELKVIVERIADGVPLKSYTNAVLHGLRDLPGGADSLAVRRTEISGLEAREFFFTLPDPRGETTRRMIWSTVSGPNAISLVFITPEANAAELEPYFKAVIESVVIFESDAGYEIFERLRSAAIKQDKPVGIDQVRSLVEAFTGFSDTARAKAVDVLVSIFDSTPDAAVELLIDRDPIVRASAIEAAGRSSNRGLDGFLVRALADPSAAVAVRAARSLAKRDDIVKLLREDSAGWEGLQENRVMRIVPFLDEPARNQLVDQLLRYRVKTNNQTSAKNTPGAPPPPAAAPTHSEPSKRGASAKSPTSDRAKLKSLGTIGVSASARSYRENVRIVLDLLPDLQALAPMLPASKLLEEADPKRALQLALDSRTRLPIDALMRLLSNNDQELAHLIALNLATSATGRELARIEATATKASTASSEKMIKGLRPLSEELRVTVKMIRWRERLEAADSASRAALFKEAFADEDLAEWAWPYVRDYIEGPAPKQLDPLRVKRDAVSGAEDKKPAGTVATLAENLLPKNTTLYAAIPDAGAFVDKLIESISSVQLDSARAQAKLLLVFNAIGAQFGKTLGVHPGRSLLQSSGIKSHSEAVFARWTADAAPRGLITAERKAVIFRVQDHDRFEQFVAAYHEFGRFQMLPEYVSMGARFISTLPALLPLSASMFSGQSDARPDSSVLSKHTLIGYEICEGYPVTVFERRESLSNDALNRDTVYLTYVGDAAILASDWFSLRDCLVRMSGRGETLASNAAYKQAVAGGGDVIYLSEPLLVMTSAARKAKSSQLIERGALRISKESWDSSFDLSFAATGWQKLFSFKPMTLKSPGVLLPASSIAYLLMSFDFATGWRLFASDVLGAETAKQFTSVWSIDFEREVLAELGPECGVVLLGMPSMKDGGLNAPWALFIQTKSDKLSKLLAEGKLIKGASAGAVSGRVKMGSSDYWIAVKKGFLVLSSSEAALSKFDSVEHLDRTREFAKALKTAPDDVIALGGVSLDAATTGVFRSTDPATSELVEVLLSLARAFHSLNLHAAASDNGLSARMSVSLDRQGRYSVSDLASVAKDFQFAAAEVEARGVPIVDQGRIDSLALKITSKAPGVLHRLTQDVASAGQLVEEKTDGSIVLTVRPRRAVVSSAPEIPVTRPELGEFLKPAGLHEDQTVLSQAREIAGKDRDAWSVARKLADWTFNNLKWKRVDGASAAATLATREADCQEFSELFVAMARGLGLPARIVSGLAHSGNSFGGHAWVEVWVGEWLELDPTWGTNFVDATHIRSSSSELLAYAALNVIGIEVIEARRDLSDFQKDPRALVDAICEELNGQRTEALSIAVDPAVLIDTLMGEGAWTGMSGEEREKVYLSQERLISAIRSQYRNDGTFGPGARVLKLNRDGVGGEALLSLPDLSDSLIRLTLAKKNGAWFVTEIKNVDLDYNLIADNMRPIISVIQAKQKGAPPPRFLQSPQSRILNASAQDLNRAVQIADQAIKDDPGSLTLRYMKGLFLLKSVEDANSAALEEAIKLLGSLADEQTNYAPAVRELGEYYASAAEDDADFASKQEQAIRFLKRYAAQSPDDPRPHETLAEIYAARGEQAAAEAEYRELVRLDQFDPGNYLSLASFLMTQRRYKDALAVVDQTRGRGTSKEKVFANLFFTGFGEPGGAELAEGLAAESSDRVINNFDANVNLARVRILGGHPREALPLLKRAIQLDSRNATPHTLIAEAQRQLHNWVAALKSAGAALTLDEKDSDSYFIRACALAQLRRSAEAVAALRKSLELDSEYSAADLEKEPDLKPLTGVPAFKKLVEELKRSERAPADQQKKEAAKQI